MSPLIRAPQRFSLFTAFLILLGMIAAEIITRQFVDAIYALGAMAGLYASAHDESEVEASLTIVAQVTAFGAITLLALARNGENWRSLGRWRFSPAILPLAFLPIVASMPIFISEVDNFLRALSWENGLDDWDLVPDLGELVGGSWQGLVLAVVIAPITEEILFRGIILRGLLGRWNEWAAIFVSAALFALMHFNPAQAPIAFALGTVLGWVYVRTRSIGRASA